MIACVWTPREGCQFTGGPTFDVGFFQDTGNQTGDNHDCLVAWVSPEVNSPNVWTWTSVWLQHPQINEALSVNLREMSPVAQMIPLQQVEHGDGTLLEFVPERRLTADADYQVEIASCKGIIVREFHTGLDGLGVFKEELQTHGWVLNPKQVEIAEPIGFLDMIPLFLPSLYLGVSEAGELTLGTAVDDQQNWCLPTVSVPLMQRNLPEFSLAGVSLPTAFKGHNYTLYDVQLSGTFVEQEGYLWTNMTFSLDTRELQPILGGQPDGLCAALADTGCVPCNDGQPYCAPLHIWNFQGNSRTNPISPVTDYNCTDCATQAPTADAICAGP